MLSTRVILVGKSKPSSLHCITIYKYPFGCQHCYLKLFYKCSRDFGAKTIIIDPALYHTKKSGVFWAKERRSIPSSFKLFTGKAVPIISFM